MPTSFTPSDVASILTYLIPGFVALSVRSQFVTTPHTQQNERLLSYMIISVIYNVIVIRFLPEEIAGWWFGLGFILVFIFGPAIVGVVWGFNIQKNFVRGLLSKFKLTTIHPIPTAWDWRFSNAIREMWVLVTLKNGSMFGGLLNDNYFASSDPIERDLYIEWMYAINDDDSWTPLGQRGILITANEISTVEFWPYVPPGDNADE